jgi:hypothetical protein
MTTIAERTVPGVGRRMLLIGAAGLLLGGLAGGLEDRALQPEEASPPQAESTVRAVPGGQATDIEAVRAQNHVAPRPSR